MCWLRVWLRAGVGKPSARTRIMSAQPSAASPSDSLPTTYCFRLRHSYSMEPTRRPACRRALWELERKAHHNCSGSTSSRPYCYYYSYHYHHLALLVLCSPLSTHPHFAGQQQARPCPRVPHGERLGALLLRQRHRPPAAPHLRLHIGHTDGGLRGSSCTAGARTRVSGVHVYWSAAGGGVQLCTAERRQSQA